MGSIIANAGTTQESEQTPKQTIKDHDLIQLGKLQNELFCELLSTTFLHFGTKAGKPLLFVPLLGIMNKAFSSLIQIHLYGRKAVGALKRPFQSGIESLLSEQVHFTYACLLTSMNTYYYAYIHTYIHTCIHT